jgi:hypothetical protein
LADTEPQGDLALRQVSEEGEGHDLALTAWERPHEVGKEAAVFNAGEGRATVTLSDVASAIVAVVLRRREWRSAPGTGCVEAPHNVADREARVLGDLDHDRFPPQPSAEVLDRCIRDEVHILDAPGRAHEPPPVPEMALERTQDDGCGVSREFHAALGVVAPEGLEESHERDLAEVIAWLAPVQEPVGELHGERLVPLQQLGFQSRVV